MPPAVNFQPVVQYSGPGLMPKTSGGGSFGQISFPIKTDVDLINDSILQILLTNYGERWMRPNFGANIKLLLFETVPVVMQRLGQMIISQAVAAVDPRITLVSVAISTSQYSVNVSYIFKLVQIGLNGSGFLEFPRQQ